MAKPFTQKALPSPAQATSTGTADIKTITLPVGTSAILISVETTNARVTFDGTNPSASNGQVFPFGQMPAYLPIGGGVVVKFASTAAANSTVNISALR